MVRTIIACIALVLSGCAPVRQQSNSGLLPSVAPRTEVADVIPQQMPKPKNQHKQQKQQGPLVFLDAGHGGQDQGAASRARGLKEKVLTLEIARRVEGILRGLGYQVSLSRTKDVAISLPRRVQMSIQKKADIFVSIHINSAFSTNGQGAEVYYYAKSLKGVNRAVASKRLGSQILSHLCRDLPIRSRGVKSGNFYVIRESTMPAVLVECAFITNPRESLFLASVHYRQQIACAIAKGINDYFQNSQ